ncbi:MAG: hypothetical protein GY768_24465, partial [Planctomycetaceae bacterium]|nr:hypothetical protein [Planctomycetaceae bacterium]
NVLVGPGGGAGERTVGGAAGLRLPGRFATSPSSDIVPGMGAPTVEELAQWKEGTHARYPCCRRVQPCGLIYCLFCSKKLVVKWIKVTPVAPEEVPRTDEPTTAQQEAWRLDKAFRTFRFGSTGGRSTEQDFARRLRGALRYRQRWVNLSYPEVCENASKGYCSEVPGAGVVLPWEPESTLRWHPDLMPSLRQKMLDDDIFNQVELDMKFASAASVRIML